MAINATREDSASVIPQGVTLPELYDAPRRAALRQSLGIAPDDIIILYVGSISARKGVLSLVKCFAELAATTPDARLIIVGPAIEPEYGADVFRYIADHKLGDRITHVPYAEDPGQYYQASDVFAFASYSEGFGNV